jgi:hypothetical protein
MKYDLLYDYHTLATVEIEDVPAANQAIAEMVEFRSEWRKRLALDGGDYIQCWLRQLAMHILDHGKLPDGEEGWCPLDGSYGIRIEGRVCPFEFDEEQVEIIEVT